MENWNYVNIKIMIKFVRKDDDTNYTCMVRCMEIYNSINIIEESIYL